MTRLSKRILIILTPLLLLLGCFSDKNEAKEIRFGTSFGHFTDMVRESIIPELSKQGYKVTLTQFTDGIQLNNALNEEHIDVNIFQHVPYLKGFRERTGYELIEAFQVPNAPFAMYAGQKKSLSEISEGDIVIVPNDPSSLGRALVILESLGWIELAPNLDPLTISKRDIISNPLKLDIKELQSDILPRALDDAAFGAINGGAALNSGLKISEALSLEPNDLYINWGVVREKDINAVWLSDVINAFNSDSFKKYSREKFKGYQFPKHWD